MPTILSFAAGSFAGNRLGARAPQVSQMPGLQLWTFPRVSLANSPNQAPGGPAMTVTGTGIVFNPTYTAFPGSQTTQTCLETSIPDAANGTYMAVARTSAPGRFSAMIASTPPSAPVNGINFCLYNVGNAMTVFATGTQGSQVQQALTGEAEQVWGFYAMRVTSGTGITTWAKTNAKQYTISNSTPRVVGVLTYRLGMDNATPGNNNAAIDIAWAGIIAGSTTGSAISDALVEQCYQSVKYSLSLDGIVI